MRFAVGILEFSEGKGGAERYLVNLCTQMAEEGHEVHVYARTWESEDSRLHFHRINVFPFPTSLRLLLFALHATKEMARGNHEITFGVGNTLRADILQPHGGVHWAWFWRSLQAYDHPLARATKFLGRMISPKQWASGWIEDAPYRDKGLTRIIAISDMVKQDLIRWYRIPEEKITVVYNGVDIERFHPRNRQYRDEVRRRHQIGEEIVLLFVSNNFRMKGLGQLMKVLSEIMTKAPPFKLLILGRDRQAPFLRLAKRIGITERVIFAGSTNEPEKYYAASDLLVHPTFYDACSLTVLEALASGLPVITTSSNGSSGIIDHREDGWIVKKLKDPAELKDGIQFFFQPDTRREAGAKARIKAEGFTEKGNFERVMKIIGEAGSTDHERGSL